MYFCYLCDINIIKGKNIMQIVYELGPGNVQSLLDHLGQIGQISSWDESLRQLTTDQPVDFANSELEVIKISFSQKD